QVRSSVRSRSRFCFWAFVSAIPQDLLVGFGLVPLSKASEGILQNPTERFSHDTREESSAENQDRKNGLNDSRIRRRDLACEPLYCVERSNRQECDAEGDQGPFIRPKANQTP